MTIACRQVENYYFFKRIVKKISDSQRIFDHRFKLSNLAGLASFYYT